jgi:hypothetical protein
MQFSKKDMSAFCIFVCFKPHEQLLSYLTAVTIADDRVANLDLCLTLSAFSSLGSLLQHDTSVYKVISDRPVIIASECRALDKGAITTYSKCLKCDAADVSGA